MAARLVVAGYTLVQWRPPGKPVAKDKKPGKPVAKDKKPDQERYLRGPLDRSWRNVLGGVLALIGLLQFIIDTDAHGFNFLSFVLMIAGLAVAGRITGLLAAYAAGVSLVLFEILISVLLFGNMLVLGFSSMTFPFTLFIKDPTAPVMGSCTASPPGWAFHGFNQWLHLRPWHPGGCAPIASERFGLAIASGVIAWVVWTGELQSYLAKAVKPIILQLVRLAKAGIAIVLSPVRLRGNLPSGRRRRR